MTSEIITQNDAVYNRFFVDVRGYADADTFGTEGELPEAQKDGVHYDDLFKEYVIVVDGEPIGYDASPDTASTRARTVYRSRRRCCTVWCRAGSRHRCTGRRPRLWSRSP